MTRERINNTQHVIDAYCEARAQRRDIERINVRARIDTLAQRDYAFACNAMRLYAM